VTAAPVPAKRMLTTEEAASYCGFTSASAFKAQARVRPVNYGKFVRYDRQRLDEWLDTLTQSAEHDSAGIVEGLFNEGRGRARP
jgi:predicted DNA-binding transcriptional regulator AlpA